MEGEGRRISCIEGSRDPLAKMNVKQTATFGLVGKVVP